MGYADGHARGIRAADYPGERSEYATTAGSPSGPSSYPTTSSLDFEMWDMRIGMTFAELDSISLHDQMAEFTCAASLPGFRTCSVPLRGSPGRMDALVDSTDRVVELTFWTGVEALTSSLTSDGGRSYDMMMGLIEESSRLASEWRDITDPDTVFSQDRGWLEMFSAGKGRWSARILWQSTGQPSMIRIADADVTSAYGRALARGQAGAQAAAAPPDGAPGPERAIRSELRRLVEAQRAFRERSGGYADGLSALHFIPREGVLVEIGGARTAGWWARGWTEDGGECVVWEGVPPPRSGGFEGRAGEPVCS